VEFFGRHAIFERCPFGLKYFHGFANEKKLLSKRGRDI